MTKKVESGKARLIKGSLLYLWEEMKTMNMTKFKALYRIGTGYIKMKLFAPKPKQKPKQIEQRSSSQSYAQ